MDILLVGFGAIGALCTWGTRHYSAECVSCKSSDSFVLQQSDNARVTVVSRSKHNILSGEA